MEFIGISKNLQYTDVIAGQYHWDPVTATWQTTKASYHVIFEPRSRVLTDWEEEKARRLFAYKTPKTLADGVTVVDPVRENASIFNTEWVPEQHRDHVEKFLLTFEDRDRNYFLSETPPAVRPWPAYDEVVTAQGKTTRWVVDTIVTTVGQTGVDPAQVLAYERENLNRPEVVDALEELIGRVEEDDKIEVSV